MVSREGFAAAVVSEDEPERRIAIVGALLGRTISERIVIVGGSDIAIYTSGPYASNDIDVVGPKSRIVAALREWGFQRDEQGQRPCWIRPDLHLNIDIRRSRYSGLDEHVRRLQTPLGPVHVAAPEDLLLRRMIIFKQGQTAALNEVAPLLDQFADDLDYGYLRARARYERVEDRPEELL
jgi:hypothetical protein